MRVRASSALLVLAAVLAAVVVACGGQEPPTRQPAPPPGPNDPPELARIASACARLSACTQAAAVARVRDPGACVDWWLSEVDAKGKTAEPLRKCLLEANTCDRVHACMAGGGDARAATFCAARPGVVSGCDGDRLVSCGEDDAHESTVVDCAASGASCKEVKSAGGLVVRACWSAQKCPAGAPETRCEGDGSVVSCRDGAFERVVCAPGTRCEERRDDYGEVSASCELPGGRRCDLRGARHCEEGRLVECDKSSPYRKARVSDCAGFGLRCAGLGPRARCTVPSDVECDKELLPKCDGDSVVFCAAGRLTKVACGAIGLGACDPSAKGPIAACSAGANTPSAPAPATSGK